MVAAATDLEKTARRDVGYTLGLLFKEHLQMHEDSGCEHPLCLTFYTLFLSSLLTAVKSTGAFFTYTVIGSEPKNRGGGGYCYAKAESPEYRRTHLGWQDDEKNRGKKKWMPLVDEMMRWRSCLV